MIVLDLDGVLADFTTASCVVHGKEDEAPGIDNWDFFKEWGLSGSEFWEPIHVAALSFYKDLVDPYPWMEELILAIDDADDFVILSAPSQSEWCYAGKKVWVDQHIAPVLGRSPELMIGSKKHLLAGPDRLLVDDNDGNVQKFTEAGGHTVTFPQLWNSQASLTGEARMAYIHHALNFWKSYRGSTAS